MDKEAEALIAETQAINIVDTSQYPQCKEMENRSLSNLACTAPLLPGVQQMLVLGDAPAHLVLHGRCNDSPHVACCCSDASRVAWALLHIS